jgi:hypothetical protein
MPIRIKPASASADKYTRNTGNASQSYKDGINNMRRDWSTVTAASENAWEGGVQAAISSKSFSRGITPDAAAKQKNNALTLGATRYGPGTANAVPSWVKFTQPVLDAMAAVGDMPRGPKMSSQNFDKQHAYAAAAHGAKKNK